MTGARIVSEPTYQSVEVHPALRPFVRQILVQDDAAEAAASTYPYTVFAQPYPVLGMQYRGQLHVLRAGNARPLDRSGLSGLQTSVRQFVADAQARSILVVLHPHGAYGLFGCPLDEVTNEHVGLSALAGAASVRALDEQLCEASTLAERSDLLQAFLLMLPGISNCQVHPVVAEAVRRILRQHGTGRVKALATALSVSDRYLERLFRSQVGVTPKVLASLAQFDWVRAQATTDGHAPVHSWADLAGLAGYVDQAHLTRSFRTYSGTTPARYLAATQPA
jgi:AraC-like DNA-binding protein